MVRVFALGLLALLLSSCDLIFQSYYPSQLEFQDQAIDLKSSLGGKDVRAVKLGYLPKSATLSRNLLAVLVQTSEGSVMRWYNPDNLSLLSEFSGATLTAMNGGVPAKLGLFGQDYYGVYAGPIQFSGSRPQPIAGSLAPYYFTVVSPSTPYDSVKLVWDDSVPVARMFTTQGNLFQMQSTPNYADLGNGSPDISVGLSGYSTQVLGVYYAKGMTGAIVLSSDAYPYEIQFYHSADPLFWAAPNYTMKLQDRPDLGWAMTDGVVLSAHGDNGQILRAYSWSGKAQGEVTLAEGDQTSLVFAPSGDWFLYQPSTGKLTRNRPWWGAP